MLTRHDLPAEPATVPVVRRSVTAAVAAAGAPDDVVWAVALAVTEATTNVVIHAYRDHEVPGRVTVVVGEDDGHVVITVADDGSGIVPRADSPGLGLGMAMIASMAEQLDVTSRPGGGAEVCMRFSLAG